MRWVLAGVFAASVWGCKREAPVAATPVSSGDTNPTPAAQPPMPAVDVGPPQPTGIDLHDTTCGWSVMAGRAAETDASVVDMVLDAVDQEVTCAVPDGGVAWTLESGQTRPYREANFYRNMIRVDLTTQHDLFTSRFTARLAQQAARGDGTGCVPSGMLFRAPERMVGRTAQIEGTAHDVHEEGGNTLLTIYTDLLGRQRVDVTFLGIANARVVDGAEVVAYGTMTGSHVMQSHRGDLVVPEVAAFRCIPQEEGNAQTQTERLLRRIRRHHY